MVFNETPHQKLKYACESLSSAVALGLDTVGTFSVRLGDVLPDLISGFKELVGVKQGEPVKGLTSDQNKFMRLLAIHTYAELRYIKAYVPEGFTGRFIDLLQVIDESAVACLALESQVLNPYNTFLAGFANGTQVIRNMDDVAGHYKELAEKRDQLQKRYASLFSGRETRHSYGQVLERNADWVEVFKLSTKLYNEMKGMNRDSLADSCRKAEVYLELIERNIRSGKLKDATPEVCRGLAEGAHEIARSIEFVSITHYRTLTAFTAVDRTVDEVRRVIGA